MVFQQFGGSDAIRTSLFANLITAFRHHRNVGVRCRRSIYVVKAGLGFVLCFVCQRYPLHAPVSPNTGSVGPVSRIGAASTCCICMSPTIRSRDSAIITNSVSGSLPIATARVSCRGEGAFLARTLPCSASET
ncbi:MAG: hypothetical protein KAI07_10025 [Deltaproteobacteria bacterium]|nr:hypothetical protein [Deltaproteobacteria bacterium]